MAIRKFRYDNEVSKEKPAQPAMREDRDPVRLLTRITFSRLLSRLGNFRVMAHNAVGEETLICMGATQEEALESARKLASDLPADAVRVYLEEWQGGTCLGSWRRKHCESGDLPIAPAARRLRRRRGRLPRG